MTRKEFSIPYSQNVKAIKQRIFKALRGKCLLTSKGKYIKITSDLSTETLKARKAEATLLNP